MRFPYLRFSLALGLVGAAAVHALAAQGGCMKCHGDEAVMKAMVKPFLHASAEGEG